MRRLVQQFCFCLVVLVLSIWSGSTGADFSCVGRSVGYYADVFHGCKTFYVCDDHGSKSTFHCGPGTTFNQKVRVCDWPSNSLCETAPDWYFLNDFTYGARIPSKARPHQQRNRHRRRRKNPVKTTTRKVIYFPAYYNLKAETDSDFSGGGDVAWKSHGGGGGGPGSHYFWDEQTGKIVQWDHPIGPTTVGPPAPALVKKVVWDHPLVANPHDVIKKDVAWKKNPRRMMLYYKTD